MRVAFVLGFFDPVRKAVDKAFPSQLEDRSIIWIRQKGPGREANLDEFKSNFFDQLEAGATRIQVILAVLRGKEWIETQVTSIIQAGQFRQPEVVIEPLLVERNAQAADFVIDNLRAFSPSRGEVFSVDSLRAVLGMQKVLCVREKRHPGFRDALEQGGFSPETWDEFFSEVEFDAASKPELLAQKVKSHKHVLYAFDGFPHAFGSCVGKDGHFKARLARGVVSQFRVWLLSVT